MKQQNRATARFCCFMFPRCFLKRQENGLATQTLNSKCWPKAASLLDVWLGAGISYPVPYPVFVSPAGIMSPVPLAGSPRRPID